MKKLLGFAILFLASTVHAVTYQAVRASTANIVTPTLQTGAMNLSSGTIRNLTVSTATISSLSISTMSVSSFTATNATVTTLGATTGTITTLIATTGTITNVSGSTVTYSSATFTNVSATTATLTNVAISSMTTALPMSGRKITGLASGTAATDAAAFTQIHLMQTPQCASFTTGNTVTASSFTATSTLVSITPTSASSKIIIYASGFLEIGTQNKSGFVSLLRNTTNIGNTSGMTEAITTTGGDTAWPASFIYQDSPATTSATTYTVAIRNTDASTSITWNTTNAIATICAFEVQ